MINCASGYENGWIGSVGRAWLGDWKDGLSIPRPDEYPLYIPDSRTHRTVEASKQYWPGTYLHRAGGHSVARRRSAARGFTKGDLRNGQSLGIPMRFALGRNVELELGTLASTVGNQYGLAERAAANK